VILNKRSRAAFVTFLLLPSLILVGLFILYPLLNGVRLSVTDASPLRGTLQRPVGLNNYTRLLSDPVFQEVIVNSIVIIGLSTALSLVIGFVLALALNTRLFGTRLFRTAIFQVWIVPWIAATILWGWLFNTDYGITNYMLQSLGLIDEPARWLARPALAQFVIILGFIWRTIPLMMVVSLAALQGIPHELVEAAAIDGAAYLNRLRFVVIPMVRNVLLTVALLQAVRMFQEITMPWILTGGGPVNATTTFSLYTYKLAFERWEFGLASAAGTLWLIFVTVFAILYMRFLVTERD
jgi:multiple sugar transport system permease protein